MAADFYPFEPAFLSRVAVRIINEVRSINRVVYYFTSTSPGTIEWESQMASNRVGQRSVGKSAHYNRPPYPQNSSALLS